MSNDTILSLFASLESQSNHPLAISIVDFAKSKNAIIQKITLNNSNDYKILNKIVISQIYSFPEKKVIISNDIQLKDVNEMIMNGQRIPEVESIISKNTYNKL